MFHKSSYWLNWSRVWIVGGNNAVYMNMTPVNGFRGHNDHEVRDEFFRGLCGLPTTEDIVQSTLPTLVRQEMKRVLGGELTAKLMFFDYMSIITPEEIDAACRKSNGGGVPLAFILSLRTNPEQFHINK